MAKLHDTSVTGNINASGTIYANGKAVAPLDHTHSVEAITGLDKSVKDIVNATPVANATNATQLAGKTADQYALKSDLTALGESLNTVQYAITKLFKCPRYVSSSYDNKFVQVKLAHKFIASDDVIIEVEDNNTKFTLYGTTNAHLTGAKINIKKFDKDRYFGYYDAQQTIFMTTSGDFVFRGVGLNDELVSVTIKSSHPIEASDFTLLPRDMSVNYNNYNMAMKRGLTNIDIIPFISDNFSLDNCVYKVNTLFNKKPSYLKLENVRGATGNFVIYDLTNMVELYIGTVGLDVFGYYNGSGVPAPIVLKSYNEMVIDLTNLSTNLAVRGDCIAYFKYNSNIPSYTNAVTLPSPKPESAVVGTTFPTLADVSKILGQSVTINGRTYDTNTNIDLQSTQVYPATAINGQTLTIGGENTITARANGGNADTVGGLSPNSFITTDNLARKYYSKVAVYDNDNHLIHPDGTEEWIEYQRPVASEDNLDHL